MAQIERLLAEMEQNKGIDGVARNVPQNAIGKFVADNLHGGRDFLNQKFGLPFVETGIGLGDLFMGQAPEMIEDASWGQPIIQPTGHGGKLDSRMGDVLGLPLPYAGAGQLGKLGLRSAGKGIDGLMNPNMANKSLSEMAPKQRAREAERRVNNMFDGMTGDRRVAKDRRLEGMPQDPSKRNAVKGVGALLAAAALPGAAKNLMSAMPDVAKAAVPDIARTAAPAAARGIGMMLSPLTPKLGNFLLNSAEPAVLLKALKEGGPDALTKKFKEVDGIQMDFPDYKDYADEVDFDELEEFIANPDVVHMNYGDRMIGYDDLIDDPGMDRVRNSNSPDTLFDYLATYSDAGVDPVQVLDEMKNVPGLESLPNYKYLMETLDKSPDALRKMIDRKVSTSSVVNYGSDFVDYAGRQQPDMQAFLLEKLGQ
jgi:hypothetical protein